MCIQTHIQISYWPNNRHLGPLGLRLVPKATKRRLRTTLSGCYPPIYRFFFNLILSNPSHLPTKRTAKFPESWATATRKSKESTTVTGEVKARQWLVKSSTNHHIWHRVKREQTVWYKKGTDKSRSKKRAIIFSFPVRPHAIHKSKWISWWLKSKIMRRSKDNKSYSLKLGISDNPPV